MLGGIRVRAAGRVEVAVDCGAWRGDDTAFAPLESFSGVGASYLDPDHQRAVALAEAVGGDLIDRPRVTSRPPAARRSDGRAH